MFAIIGASFRFPPFSPLVQTVPFSPARRSPTNPLYSEKIRKRLFASQAKTFPLKKIPSGKGKSCPLNVPFRRPPPAQERNATLSCGIQRGFSPPVYPPPQEPSSSFSPDCRFLYPNAFHLFPLIISCCCYIFWSVNFINFSPFPRKVRGLFSLFFFIGVVRECFNFQTFDCGSSFSFSLLGERHFPS